MQKRPEFPLILTALYPASGWLSRAAAAVGILMALVGLASPLPGDEPLLDRRNILRQGAGSSRAMYDPQVLPVEEQQVQFQVPQLVQPQLQPQFQAQAQLPAPQQPQIIQPQGIPKPAEPALGAPDELAVPGLSRLQMLTTESTALGSTPRPTPEVKAQFREYVEGIIDPSNTLDLIRGRPRILLFKSAPTRVQIADDETANYTVITPNELSVTGKAVGSTVLNLWFPDPKAPEGSRILSYLVRVLPDPEDKDRLDRIYKALELEINKAFPDSVVHIMLVGDKVVVTGEAKDIVECAQIMRIVSAHAPGGGGQRGAHDKAAAADEIPALPNEFGELPPQSLEKFLRREVDRNVVNLLHVPGEQQVMLRVSVAEVNRSAARSIGMDFSITNGRGLTVFAQQTAAVTSAALSGAAAATSGANLPVMLDNGQISLAIRALRTLNLARSLAEPNLVTLNGQPATFLAGGQFPVPSAAVTFGAVGQSVAFIPFGVQIRFIPYITDRDRVRLQVLAIVSTLDATLTTNISGSSVPGLNTRTFSNTVEMRSGQTLAVAGLLNNNYGATANRVPLFGDLPVVGDFFGRNTTSSQEQEVVVLVSPDLVHPLDDCKTPGVPGDDVFEPGDVEFFLLNRLESRRSEDYRTVVRTDWARMHQYQHCEDRFIIGTKGQYYGCCPINEKERQINAKGRKCRSGHCRGGCPEGGCPEIDESLSPTLHPSGEPTAAHPLRPGQKIHRSGDKSPAAATRAERVASYEEAEGTSERVRTAAPRLLPDPSKLQKAPAERLPARRPPAEKSSKATVSSRGRAPDSTLAPTVVPIGTSTPGPKDDGG